MSPRYEVWAPTRTVKRRTRIQSKPTDAYVRDDATEDYQPLPDDGVSPDGG